MVGLQAMTEFVHQAVPAGFDLHLDVRAQHSDAHFDVTTSNALVLQSKDVSFGIVLPVGSSLDTLLYLQ